MYAIYIAKYNSYLLISFYLIYKLSILQYNINETDHIPSLPSTMSHIKMHHTLLMSFKSDIHVVGMPQPCILILMNLPPLHLFVLGCYFQQGIGEAFLFILSG